MSSPKPFGETATAPGLDYTSEDSDGQARGGRKNRPANALTTGTAAAPVETANLNPKLPSQQPAGQLLKGAVDEHGNQKAAALLVGIKLDLEAEIHLTARIKGDIAIGLY